MASDEAQNLDVQKHLTFTERYFTKRYFKNKEKEGEDVCILAHSNKICVITLAENHPILRDGKTVTSVHYQFDNVNRLCNMVSGKGKKGAQHLNSGSKLCRVTCDDGNQYYIPCGMKCQLLETNDALKNHPEVLMKKPMTDGYIAVVMPKLKDYPGEMKKLLTSEQYNLSCEKSITDSEKMTTNCEKSTHQFDTCEENAVTSEESTLTGDEKHLTKEENMLTKEEKMLTADAKMLAADENT